VVAHYELRVLNMTGQRMQHCLRRCIDARDRAWAGADSCGMGAAWVARVVGGVSNLHASRPYVVTHYEPRVLNFDRAKSAALLAQVGQCGVERVGGYPWRA
jgi:hypothetical protein